MKIIIIAIYLFAAISSHAVASETIQIEEAWIRSAPKNAKAMAAFMTITNNTDSNVALQSVSCELFKRVELHVTEKHDGMMKMVRQKKIDIKARKTIRLKPGGYHIMLIKPKAVPLEDDMVELTLNFDNGYITKELVVVRRASGKSSMMGGHHY